MNSDNKQKQKPGPFETEDIIMGGESIKLNLEELKY
jgi:hypothetical protein